MPAYAVSRCHGSLSGLLTTSSVANRGVCVTALVIYGSEKHVAFVCAMFVVFVTNKCI